MPAKIVFPVAPRQQFGKKLKPLRDQFFVPGNVYGLGKASVAVQFFGREFTKLYDKVGETGVVYLQIEGAAEKPVLIDEVQVDPVSAGLLHVSFKEVDLTQEVEAEVPVELVGEFELPQAVLVQVLDTIEVKALPNDLPEKFVVDVTKFTEIGQMITLADLVYDRDKVKITEIETAADEAKPVVLVQEQREEEEPEPVAPAEVEITGEAKPEGEGGEEAAGEEKKTAETPAPDSDKKTAAEKPVK